MRILIYDSITSYSYDAEVMAATGIGGTESTLVRVAEGLSSTHEVVVAQRARLRPASPHAGLRYTPLDEPDPFGGSQPDWVAVLRKHRRVRTLRARFPSAAMISWIHNWQRLEKVIQRFALARSDCSIVTVSDAHRHATDRLINGSAARVFGALVGGSELIPVRRIYNPVDEALSPDGTPVDRNKLVFFSTANKGLKQVLATFAHARKSIPRLQLYVAGTSLEVLHRNFHIDKDLMARSGVHLLGRLSQRETFQHVREALCVFYPQNLHAETFGLVFAESNALGTPVMAHDFGSAREVLGGAEQLVDASDRQAILAKLRDWQDGNRPIVSLRPEFRASSVVEQWRQLFENR